MPMIVALILVAVVIVARVLMVRQVEARDRQRARNANGIVVGAEGFLLDRVGAPGVLLLHGGGDTPDTLRELGMYLHERGFAVLAPLLPGHGTSVRDFRRVDSAQWQAAALAAFDAVATGREWAGVVGLSMGGALAAGVVARRPDARALVLLAPYLDMPAGLRWAATLSYVAGLFSPYFGSNDPRSIRDPAVARRSVGYGVFTPAAMRALRDTADAGREALDQVVVPTLIVQSREDNRIAPGIPVAALARLAATDKRLEWVSEGGHVITVDFGKERVFSLAGDWLVGHGAGALLRA